MDRGRIENIEDVWREAIKDEVRKLGSCENKARAKGPVRKGAKRYHLNAE